MNNNINLNKSQDNLQKTWLNDLNLLNLYGNLPKKPYCSDNLEFGLKIRKLDYAISQKYIQINNPSYQQALIFDIDAENCFFQFEKNNCPTPNIIIKNNINGHCHYIYQLQKGFYKNKFESFKTLKYAAAIENALCRKLEADLNYVGLVAKNPFNDFWKTSIIEDRYYDLDYLADYLDLSKSKKIEEQINQNSELGRNCFLFEELRLLAYKTFKYYQHRNREDFFTFLLKESINLNNSFQNRLQNSELKSICKSITKFCYTRLNIEESNKRFSELQQFRSKQRKYQKVIDFLKEE